MAPMKLYARRGKPHNDDDDDDVVMIIMMMIMTMMLGKALGVG